MTKRQSKTTQSANAATDQTLISLWHPCRKNRGSERKSRCLLASFTMTYILIELSKMIASSALIRSQWSWLVYHDGFCMHVFEYAHLLYMHLFMLGHRPPFLTQLCLDDLFSDKYSPCEDWPVMICHFRGGVKGGEEKKGGEISRKKGQNKHFVRVGFLFFFTPSYPDLISTLFTLSVIPL